MTPLSPEQGRVIEEKNERAYWARMAVWFAAAFALIGLTIAVLA